MNLIPEVAVVVILTVKIVKKKRTDKMNHIILLSEV
jgi:hypothetical protein